MDVGGEGEEKSTIIKYSHTWHHYICVTSSYDSHTWQPYSRTVTLLHHVRAPLGDTRLLG